MIEFHFSIHPDQIETISDQLMTLGAVAITCVDAEDQPIYEPLPGEVKYWQAVNLVALSENEHRDMIQIFLSQCVDEKKISAFTMHPVKEQNWVRQSLDQFQPMKFGDRLYVVPSWIEPTDVNATNVILDPGLAFGTGSHPTTCLCLTWLSQELKKGATVIDYGCGSGILAVAAMKLGAKEVIAVDHDPQALTACDMNMRLNSIDPENYTLLLPEAIANKHLKVDVVIANILLQPLLQLKASFEEWLMPGGRLVLSGLLSEQVSEIASVYQPSFSQQMIAQKDNWVCIELIKNTRD